MCAPPLCVHTYGMMLERVSFKDTSTPVIYLDIDETKLLKPDATGAESEVTTNRELAPQRLEQPVR